MEPVNRTKFWMSSTLKEMALEMPLKKITVTSLCIRGNVNRGTFYYHFKDIQDLINWTYHTEISLPAWEVIANSHSVGGLGTTVLMMTTLYRSRAFYTQAIHMQGQNNLQDYILQESFENWRRLWAQILGKDVSDTLAGTGMDYVLEYFCLAHYHSVMHWMQNGMKEPLEEMSRILDMASLRGLGSVWAEILEKQHN